MNNAKKIYMAPMEGVTGFIYRNTYARFFGGVDKYYTPFISPGEHRNFKSRELKDVLPENNDGLNVAIQMLTNNAQHFIVTAHKMKDFGYREVNLNLGCPSGTVVAKGKGSGFLSFPKELDKFLDEIYNGLADTGLDISIKTRLGRYEPDEFYELLEIYNKYPVSELIIHPRVQKDMYKNKPRMDYFDYAVKNSKNLVVYNGDIFTQKDYENFSNIYFNEEYNRGKLENSKIMSDDILSNIDLNANLSSDKKPVNAVMLGRGLIANPNLAENILNGTMLDKNRLKGFYDALAVGYKAEIKDEKNVMFKLKEVLFYLVNVFEDRDKYWKKIRKTNDFLELNILVNEMFTNGNIAIGQGFTAF